MRIGAFQIESQSCLWVRELPCQCDRDPLEVGGVSARQRLEQLLWQLACDRSAASGKPALKFQLPLRSWEAAQLLAITPTYLSRLFGELEREEIISRSKGWILIKQPTRLWHALDS